MSLQAFPCCGIALGPLELGNPEGFSTEPFVRVESAAVDFRIWPLLVRQELAVGDITLAGFDVRLIRRADGAANWEFAAADPWTLEWWFKVNTWKTSGVIFGWSMQSAALY